MTSNPFIESHPMCKVFPLSNDFLIGNGHFRLKNKGNRCESSKSIENKCTHWALRLVLIGKHAQCKGNIKHVRTWSQAISSNFSCLFRSKIAKIAKDKCFYRAMDFDYCFQLLSTTQSQGIVSLWVHPLMALLVKCPPIPRSDRSWILPCNFNLNRRWWIKSVDRGADLQQVNLCQFLYGLLLWKL